MLASSNWRRQYSDRDAMREGVDYSDGLIYYGPLALALATLPLLVIGLSRPWGATPSPKQPDDSA